jgi:hypothetical protein
MNADRTLIRIRERSFLDLLDLGLLVLRRRPIPLLLASSAGILPFAALNAWLLASRQVEPFQWMAILYMEAPWATLPLTIVLGGLLFGESPGAREVVRSVVRALPSLILVHLVLRSLLAASVVLFVLLPARLWSASEVILLERLRGLDAVRRCWQLSRDRGGEFFFQWLAQLAFGAAFAVCFATGAHSVYEAILGSDLTWERPLLSASGAVFFHLAVWIAIAFSGITRFLVYIDERTRAEGWELRIRLQALGRALEEGQA